MMLLILSFVLWYALLDLAEAKVAKLGKGTELAHVPILFWSVHTAQ